MILAHRWTTTSGCFVTIWTFRLPVASLVTDSASTIDKMLSPAFPKRDIEPWPRPFARTGQSPRTFPTTVASNPSRQLAFDLPGWYLVSLMAYSATSTASPSPSWTRQRPQPLHLLDEIPLWRTFWFESFSIHILAESWKNLAPTILTAAETRFIVIVRLASLSAPASTDVFVFSTQKIASRNHVLYACKRSLSEAVSMNHSFHRLVGATKHRVLSMVSYTVSL